jgi:hypothetical protein
MNEFGQLGLGDKENRSKPSLVKELSQHRIVRVTCGSKHTIFLAGNAFRFLMY